MPHANPATNTIMKQITPFQAHQLLQEAYAVLLPDSSEVAEFILSDIENDSDNEFVRVSWRDEIAQEFCLIFAEQVVYLDGRDLIMTDEDGERFRLRPLFSCEQLENLYL